MEIKNNNFNKLDPYLNKANLNTVPQGVNSAKIQAKNAQSGSDVVHLSSNELKTAVINEAVKISDIRQDKVDAIKERLNNGTYEINSKDIAAKMLEMEKDLLA